MPKTFPLATEAEWLALREDHIGGSDIACLFYRWLLPDGSETVLHLFEIPPEGAQIIECISTYKTGYRLWHEKAGLLKPNFESNERMDAGRHMEPAMATWAQEKWPDMPIRKVRRYMSSSTVAGMGASLDYEIWEKGRAGAPVEFKLVDWSVWRDQWVTADGEIVMPPLSLTLQLQHQIAVAETDHGWMIAGVGGNKLVRGRVDRHRPTIAKIEEAVTVFWRAVAAGTPPAHVADYETVRMNHPDGNLGLVDLTGDIDLPTLAWKAKRLQRHIGRMEARLDLVKASISDRIGDHSKAVIAGYKISWPVIDIPEKVVPEKLQPARHYRGALTITEEKK